MIQLTKNDRDSILNRFIRYAKIWTTSDSARADQGIQPSTERQFDLARVLEAELRELGLKNVQVTDHCYVYGLFEGDGTDSTKPEFCLLAHMDTVEEVSGKDVKPQLHKVDSQLPDGDTIVTSDSDTQLPDGGTVVTGNSDTELHDGDTIITSDGDTIITSDGDTELPDGDTIITSDGDTELPDGDTIITSDGTTLLGADDKSGITAIMHTLTFLKAHPEFKHKTIEVCFSPDEETGHGMDNVPLELIQSKQAYTVDGGELGQLETECFNAYRSDIVFTGVAQHTGTARGKLVNALSMAAAFITMLPHNQAPETTDGYEGFYAPMEIDGTLEKSHVNMILRDFEEDGMNKKLAFVEQLAQTVAARFGGKAEVTNTCQYKNMKEGLQKSPQTVENLINAYKASGIEPIHTPIRGGTDGSRLTEMGIPTPNIFTGGSDFHSRKESLSLNGLCKCVEVLINLTLKQEN